MIFIEDGQVWESFVYVPKKPIAINPDGSWNTQKVCELVVKAKAGDEQAIMQLFEQYQYLWKKEITGFVEDMLGYEDAQQEAFYIFMISLKSFDNIDKGAFTGYYQMSLRNHLALLTGKERDEKKQWLFSLDARDDEGNLLHDIADVPCSEMLNYRNIKKLLTDLEYKVLVAHYVYGISYKVIAKHYGLTIKYLWNLSSSLKKKLKVLL